jgi:hypothetical protein
MLAIVPILFLSFNSSTISSAQSSGRDEVLLRVIVVNTENEAKQILEELKSGKELPRTNPLIQAPRISAIWEKWI